jgi:hypothetical protein
MFRIAFGIVLFMTSSAVSAQPTHQVKRNGHPSESRLLIGTTINVNEIS